MSYFTKSFFPLTVEDAFKSYRRNAPTFWTLSNCHWSFFFQHNVCFESSRRKKVCKIVTSPWERCLLVDEQTDRLVGGSDAYPANDHLPVPICLCHLSPLAIIFSVLDISSARFSNLGFHSAQRHNVTTVTLDCYFRSINGI